MGIPSYRSSRRRSSVGTTVAGVGLLGLAVALFAAVIFLTPWLLMLALGNFGFARFGFLDCLPAGLLVAGLKATASASSS